MGKESKLLALGESNSYFRSVLAVIGPSKGGDFPWPIDGELCFIWASHRLCFVQSIECLIRMFLYSYLEVLSSSELLPTVNVYGEGFG